MCKVSVKSPLPRITSIPSGHSFYTDQMLFLSSQQQYQSAEGIIIYLYKLNKNNNNNSDVIKLLQQTLLLNQFICLQLLMLEIDK